MNPQRTQKQIAEKYKGNLAYYRHGHYFRRLRGLLFVLSVVGSIAAVLTFRDWGKPSYFSTGPISAGHAGFANDCRQCHEGVEPDVAKKLGLDEIVEKLRAGGLPSLAHLGQRMKDAPAKMAEQATQENLLNFAESTLQLTTLNRMDKACTKCHDPQRLHQPQAGALAMRGITREMPLVHSGSCAQCHREHLTHGRMASPDSRSCESCHNDVNRLTRSLNLVQFDQAAEPPKPANIVLPDGLRHFVVPRPEVHRFPVFRSFADGHPAFDYEQPGARDPTAIKFNHKRHGQPDIPKIDGRELSCVDCHKPTGDGAHFARITYQAQCARCHSLHIEPDMPEITMPHGDPSYVRAYVQNLPSHYANYAVKTKGITDRVQLGNFLKMQSDQLKERGLSTVEELEKRIFYTGDPPPNVATPVMKRGKGVFFPGCAKCHELTPPQPAAGRMPPLPRITPFQPADRWLNRGPFTHAKHTHQSCMECHNDPTLTVEPATGSLLTSDILLPRQAICAQCHRPAAEKSPPLVIDGLDPRAAQRALAEKQRRDGGVPGDCQVCHKFHAGPEAAEFAKDEPLEKQ